MKISFNICPSCGVGTKNLKIKDGFVNCTNCWWFGTTNHLKKIVIGGRKNG